MNYPKLYTWISSELKSRGIHNKRLLEELTDHYMEEYENTLIDTKDTTLAHNKVIAKMNAVNLKKINRDTNIIFYKPCLQLSAAISIAIIFLIYQKNLYHLDNEPPSIWPVNVETKNIGNSYGLMFHPIHKVKKFHKGLDIKGNIGEPVYATSNGLVESSSYNRGLGYYIIIKHDDKYQTKYCHLSELLVEAGMEVKIGDRIGSIGNSGLSTAPHLHYEVLINGKNVNPEDYLQP